MLLSTASFVSLMAFFSFTSILKGLKDDLSLDNVQFGLLLSVFSAAYATAQIPAGILSDKFGGKIVASLGVSIMGLVALCFAFTESFADAIILRGLEGFSGGFILPSAVRLLSDWFEEEERNIAMGVFGLGQGLGFVVTYLAGSVVVELSGWRSGSLLSGMLVCALAASNWLFLRNTSLKRTIAGKMSANLFRVKGFVKIVPLLTVINSSALSVTSAVLQFAPEFVISRFGFSSIIAGSLMSLFGVTCMLSSCLGGLSAKQIGANNVLVISMLMCTVLPPLLSYIFSPILTVTFMALIGFATMFYFGPTFAGIPRAVGGKYTATAFGVFNTVSFGASAISPILFGYVLDSAKSYELAFSSLALVAVAGLGSAVLLKRIQFYS